MTIARIDDIFSIEKGNLQSSKAMPGAYSFITAAEEWKTHQSYTHDVEALVFAAAASGSLGRTHYVKGRFIASDLCFIITPKNIAKYPVDLKFYYFVFNNLRQRIVQATKTGTSKHAINLTKFSGYGIPYFDIDEQRKWTAKLSSCSQHKDALSSEIDFQDSLLSKLRKTILQDAVQGKLVPQDYSNESASLLLQRIREEKARLIKEGKLKKDKPLPTIRDEDVPFDLPRGWSWCRLGDLCLLITSGSRDWAKYYADAGAIFVRMGNLSKDDFKLRLDQIQHVQPPSEREGTRTRLEENDILVSITGDVGMLGLIPANFGEAYINQHTGLIRLVSLLNINYFVYFFLSPFAQKQFNSPQRGVKNSFRLSDIEKLLVPLPPLLEQTRIQTSLQTIYRSCSELRQGIMRSNQNSEVLMQSILKNVF